MLHRLDYLLKIIENWSVYFNITRRAKLTVKKLPLKSKKSIAKVTETPALITSTEKTTNRCTRERARNALLHAKSASAAAINTKLNANDDLFQTNDAVNRKIAYIIQWCWCNQCGKIRYSVITSSKYRCCAVAVQWHILWPHLYASTAKPHRRQEHAPNAYMNILRYDWV